MYAGDFALSATFHTKFTTRRFSTGAPFTLAGSPVVSAYEDDSTTQITAGITLTVDFDSVTGLNQLAIVASGANGYEAGKSYYLVITTGTVDSVSVVGEVVGSFTIERSAAFSRLGAPAGASVSADVAAIKAETATILSDTNDIQTRIPAALVGGRIDANVGAISSDATAADNAEAFFDGTGYAGTGNTIPTVTTLTNDPTGVGTLLTRLGTPSNLGGGATVAANLSDIEAQTDDIGAAGAGLTAVPWNAAWDAEVQSEVDDALVAQRLDELLNADSDIDGAAPPTVGSVFHELMTKTAGSFTYDQTTDALEAIRDRGDAAWTTGAGGSAPTAAEIADAVWDEATAGHTTSGTFGEQVKTDIDDILTDTGTTLQGELDGIQADTEDIQTRLPAALVSGRIDASVGAMAADVVTAAAIAADAIGSSELAASAVTEIQSGLSTLDAAGVRTAVGLASANLDTQLTAIDDFLDTEIAAIKAKTDNLPTDPADESLLEAAINAAEAAILAAIPSASSNATALLDTASGIETSITPRQAIRLILAASAGKLSGAATSTVVIRNVGDSKDRITATVSADGDRTAVSVDAT